MESATVHTAAQITGWSVRMLHYLDAAGLVSPPRSPSGYRLYGKREITHLRELRQLLADHDLRPADLQVALRLRGEPELRRAVDDWLGSAAADSQAASTPAADHAPVIDPSVTAAQGDEAHQTISEPTTSWLRFEQDKHSRALDITRHLTPSKETA